jgi:hypothetical protein
MWTVHRALYHPRWFFLGIYAACMANFVWRSNCPHAWLSSTPWELNGSGYRTCTRRYEVEMRDQRHISAVYGSSHLHLCNRHKVNTWKSSLKAVMTTMFVTSSDHSLIAWVFELIYCLYETKETESLKQQYSRITSTKFPLFCMITSSTYLTCRFVLLPHSYESSYYVIKRILAPPPLWSEKHTDIRSH